MGTQISRLPSRIPAGTRYVIEGRGGLIHLRYLEFPDGRQINLPSDLAKRTAAHRAARRARNAPKPTAKKNVTARGTTRKFGS
jgi:hypothetical protein